MRTLLPLLILALLLVAADLAADEAPPAAAPPAPVIVPVDAIQVDDGDSVRIRWKTGSEVVRILGIDTPETAHPQHDIPYAQPFGGEATGFLRGALAVADEVKLWRSGQKDPHGRTLAYLLLDGKNYSVLVVRARLAIENVSHYGDNGMPGPAAEVAAAAKKAGPVAFEAPYRYRSRMRRVSKYMKEQGRYPCPEER